MTTKNKKFTVSEFQTWLDGIMEFQESGWSPTAEQWKAIYQKIQNLKEPTTAVRKVSIDDESKEDIIIQISKNIPDYGDMDFDLLMNVLNHLSSQIRHGGQVAPQGWGGNTQQTSLDGSVPSLRSAPPAAGQDLANIPLSELRKRQGHSPNMSDQHKNERILEPDEVVDHFV